MQIFPVERHSYSTGVHYEYVLKNVTEPSLQTGLKGGSVRSPVGISGWLLHVGNW